jgi:hypothetical protein
VVTVTVTVPTAWAGALTVIEVPDTTWTVVPGLPTPKATVAPVTNPVPLRVTDEPAVSGPAGGVTVVRIGPPSNVYDLPPEVPPGVVTITVTVPAECAGAFTVIDDVDTTCTVVPAWPVPKATVAPETKPLPVSVTGVPALRGPAGGVTDDSVGTGSYVYGLALEVPPGVVTTTVTVPGAWAGDVTEILLELQYLTPAR